MKHYFFFLLLLTQTAAAQIPDGSVAPNFTATDINGQPWTLYDQLDQGKSVVIDIFTTWCGPCWAYHESGVLKEFYTQYGPDGSNTATVVMLEADDTTTPAELMGVGSNTQGNWVTGTPYPIIDNAEALSTNTFLAWGYPTTYLVCPNRRIEQVFTPPLPDLVARHQLCAVATGDDNASLFSYDGFSGTFCGSKTFVPTMKLQNLGTHNLTAATLQLYLNGVLSSTIPWTGLLKTYAIEQVSFDPITLQADTEIEIKILSPNGVADADDTNNTIKATAIASALTHQNVLTFELRTDNHPQEVYWDIRDENGILYYYGGNDALNNPTASGKFTYTQPNHVYTHTLALPADGCWLLTIQDHNGICCDEGAGYYKLMEANGTVLKQGGAFESIRQVAFEIEGANPILNNCGITDNLFQVEDFCGPITFHPFIQVLNQGANNVSSFDLTVVNTQTGAVVSHVIWTGNLFPGTSAYVQAPNSLFESSVDLDIRMEKVNGVADVYDYNNHWDVSLHRNISPSSTLRLEFTTDDRGYELFWRLRNSFAQTVASGGNQYVGEYNADGPTPASPNDPGAYGNHQLVTEIIYLDSDSPDCYDLSLLDDGGDGMVGATFQLSTENGVPVLSTEFLRKWRYRRIEVQTATGTHDLPEAQRLLLSPNPAADRLRVTLPNSNPTFRVVEILDLLGRPVRALAREAVHGASFDLDVSGLNNGVYFLRLSGEGAPLSGKFVVNKG